MDLRRFIFILTLTAAAVLISPLAAAPRKGVSLNDLVPKKPAAPAKPAPRPTPKKPAPAKAPVVAKKPVAPRPSHPVAGKPQPSGGGASLMVGPTATYRTLTAALQKAPAGARIMVAAGTYRESLTLSRSVEIAPAAPDGEVIVEGAAQPGVLMKAPRATLRNLTLRVAAGANRAAFAVDIPQGELLLDGCIIGSGEQACVGARGAAARPTLRNCRLQGEAHGLVVDAKAEATLETCQLSKNKGVGALVSGGAKASLTGCRIDGNGAQGLSFKEDALGLVDDCEVNGNRTQGVLAEGAADTVFRKTRVFRNELAGLEVRNEGKASLQECDIYENGAAGLALRTRGSLTARGTQVRLNLTEGIECAEGGVARIEGGTIVDNAAVAVAVRRGGDLTLLKSRVVSKGLDAVLINGKSRGTVEGCDLSKPADSAAVAAVHEESVAVFRSCKFRGGKTGVMSTAQANVTLDDCDVTGAGANGVQLTDTTAEVRKCRLFRNQKAGCVVAKGSQVTLTGCELYENQDTSLWVIDGTAPVVKQCSFRDSGRAGVWVAFGSRGSFEDCEMSGNAMSGVSVDKNSEPEFRRCRFLNGKGGGGHGIWIGGQSKGLLEDCTIQGNGAHGAVITERSNPLFRRCRISDNAGIGVFCQLDGFGTVEESSIQRNRGGNTLNQGKLAIRSPR